MKRYKIFVSVCSYRDPLMAQTVDSLLYYKSGQHDVIVSIFDQGTEYYEDWQRSDIIYKQIDPRWSNGVGWARHINSLNLTDEDFYYQIDSHLLFDQDWDIYLIDDYFRGVEAFKTNKILLSNACNQFEMIDDKPVLIKTQNKDAIFHGKFVESESFLEYKLLSAHGCELGCPKKGAVIEAIHTFAGNMFTHSDYLTNVGICPFMYYHGEEQYITLDAFINNYKILHHTSIHTYHLKDTTNYKTKPWHEPVVNEYRINELNDISVNYWYKFVSSIDHETLNRFYIYSGVDYINDKLDKRSCGIK